MRNSRLEVKPISGAGGAEIFGVDVARDLEADTVGEIRDALNEHCVVYHPLLRQVYKNELALVQNGLRPRRALACAGALFFEDVCSALREYLRELWNCLMAIVTLPSNG